MGTEAGTVTGAGARTGAQATTEGEAVTEMVRDMRAAGHRAEAQA